MVGNSRGSWLTGARPGRQTPPGSTRLAASVRWERMSARAAHARAGECFQATAAQVVVQFLPRLALWVKVLVTRSARTSGRARGAEAQQGQGVGLVHTSAGTEPLGSPDRGRPRRRFGAIWFRIRG